ncbi:hypothetical protein OG21DRAFT_1425088 [Imleria badia]|nr:hypothetical protein OG21DRAFT_1425088 [Imleria badia]
MHLRFLRTATLRETIHNLVQYAIFSHRWTNSEPSYQDISPSCSGVLGLGNAISAGLAKLLQLCETARALGYRLVWFDTCCINKTNPAELNQAIHPMFK